MSLLFIGEFIFNKIAYLRLGINENATSPSKRVDHKRNPRRLPRTARSSSFSMKPLDCCWQLACSSTNGLVRAPISFILLTFPIQQLVQGMVMLGCLVQGILYSCNYLIKSPFIMPLNSCV